ncbi:hypothetical protein BTA51_20360 [Hahella sp. CCB-MM4]|uniref:hypothetical protein n=1 Tax=Hahella sp. (strain CCB-MM4) TaxID=1926491 RepID=UPI000B9C2FBA|nr:hypothetical protein [Hahella sp. CCB-MM4]OZG71633.1 hypothetical protein BTA51_20360 [Hahella sp. CCB-MM4]
MKSPDVRTIKYCLVFLFMMIAGNAVSDPLDSKPLDSKSLDSSPLKIGIIEAAPWAYLEGSSYTPKGSLVLYARQLFNQLQIKHKILVLPSKRLNYMAEKGQLDIAIALDDGRIHHYMNPVKLLESVEILALSLREDSPIELELTNRPLDVMHGYKTDQDQHSVSVDINSAEQLFALFDAKRIDSGFGLKPLLMYGANNRHHDLQLRQAQPVGYADIVIWSNPHITMEISRKVRPLSLSLNI